MVRNKEGAELRQARIDEGLNPVGHRIIGVEDVEEPGAGGQPELWAQALQPPHRHEHSLRREREKKHLKSLRTRERNEI